MTAANNTSCSSSGDNMTSRCGQGCSTSTPPLSINYDQPQLTVVGFALVFVVATTMFCNLLVGFALLRFPSLRNVSNLLIGNLALSDFLLSVAVLPLSAVNECLGHWVFGQTACNVWLLVDVLFCTASIWNLCLIAFDRFTATYYPLWYRGNGRANSQHAVAYAAVVWTVAAGACVPPLFGWNDLSANYVADRVELSAADMVDACPTAVVYRCVLFRIPSYVLYSASVSFFIPTLVTFFLYVNILAELRRRRSKADAVRRLSSDRHHAQQLHQLAAADDEEGRAAGALRTSSQHHSAAVVTWLQDNDSNEPVNVDDQHSSNDSSPTSPSRPLSRSSHNEPTTTRGDDDVIHAPAPTDVTGDLVQPNESISRSGLLPLSSSDPALNAAQSFVHRFRSSAYR